MSPPIADLAVAAAFDRHPEPVRSQLLALRDLVFAVAAETEGVGAIEETLKWGQPSYVTQRPKSGTTLRMDADEARCSLFVHCQSRVVEAARAEGLPLNFEGTRAVHLALDTDLPTDAVRRFMALALTYHRWKASLPPA